MSPQLAFVNQIRSSREENSNLARFKHAISILSHGTRKHHDFLQNHDKHSSVFNKLNDDHQLTHPSIVSTLKQKLRRANGLGLHVDTDKHVFSFRALDSKKSKSGRSDTSVDHYVAVNAQTVPNDSTDNKLMRMYVEDASPRTSTASSRRRSSFGSFGSISRNQLSIFTPSARRFSMVGSDRTVASEDLTAREFAQCCGIIMCQEDDEDDEIFEGNTSILVQTANSNNNNNTQSTSTVVSASKSTKSKVSIMEESFWIPPCNDFVDKSDEEPIPRDSSDSAEVYIRPEGVRVRRNSLITFADTPSLAKMRQQQQQQQQQQTVSPVKTGVRSGRHSEPIPIPKPILVQPSQLSQSPPNLEAPITPSSSTGSSFNSSYTTVSSVSTTNSANVPTPTTPTTPNRERSVSIETPGIVAMIKNEFQLTDSPVTLKKGRFEVTIGNMPPPEFPPRSSLENTDTSSNKSTTPTEEKCVIFQRRKYRPESIVSEHGSFDDHARTPSVDCAA